MRWRPLPVSRQCRPSTTSRTRLFSNMLATNGASVSVRAQASARKHDSRQTQGNIIYIIGSMASLVYGVCSRPVVCALLLQGCADPASPEPAQGMEPAERTYGAASASTVLALEISTCPWSFLEFCGHGPEANNTWAAANILGRREYPGPACDGGLRQRNNIGFVQCQQVRER